jgi:hypothetical protein
VGGARPHPFTTITITSKVAVYAPAEWADTLTLFHLYQYMYSAGLALKNPPKKTHPKKPTKNGFFWVFLGFFKFLIFYENNTNFSL